MKTGINILIDSREPFADGVEFRSTGPYERLSGRINFTIDPNALLNQVVVDLEYAPRNPSGFVEYSADFYILKPVDLAKGNRRLIYDVVNRGNKRILQFFNDAEYSNEPLKVEHAGNGFLMRRGYTIVWSGWQGDILQGNGRMTMRLPIASVNEREINGVVRAEFIANKSGVQNFPLSGNDYTLNYETISLDTSLATFTYREYEDEDRKAIDPDDWQFAKLDENSKPVPSPEYCYLPSGFKPFWIYELIYTVKNPPILGLGFTGVRDLVSFLLHEEVDDSGTPNPLKDGGIYLEKAYAWGRSQSGRFLREYVYRGFNEDAHGHRVFNAISPHVAGAGRVFLNHRFAQPGRFPRQHENHLYPSDLFPFAYATLKDPISGKTDGILKRPKTDPLVIHTQTSSEYWQRRGSLVHTDVLGNDLPSHERARIFLFASSQHMSDPNTRPRHGPQQHPSNPLNTTPLLRALLDALDDWATNDIQPPHSRVPTIADKNLIPAEVVKTHFPTIPDVSPPTMPNRLFLLDYGPEFEKGIISKEPPEEDKSKEYKVLVPKIDSDGNEIPGIRTPHVEVPIATYTGWNFYPTRKAKKTLYGVTGSYFPFARMEKERRCNKEVRASVEERYKSKANYVRLITLAAQRLVQQRLLLEEDAERFTELAMDETDLWALRSRKSPPFIPRKYKPSNS
jgi:hypothetical protein